MAEFQEVMKQAKRMCDDQCACIACPAVDQTGKCRLQVPEEEFTPMDFDLNKLPEIERIVMEWAAKNPEPRYPSWGEWWRSTFPNAGASINPCAFGSKEDVNCDANCRTCINNPIPADIAEKLGIKPIEGEE